MDWFEIEETRASRRCSPLATAPLDDQLRNLFQLMVASPMPDRLAELADRLDTAFQRGEIDRTCCARKS